MARQLSLLEVQTDKGLFFTNDPSSLPDGYLADSRDFFVAQTPKELLVRPGFLNLAATNWPVGADWLATYRTSTRNELVCASRSTNTLYTQNQANLVTQYMTVTLSGTEMALQYGSNLYIINNNAPVYKYDGSAVTVLASTPAGSYATVMRDRLFVTVPNSTRVNYSLPGDFTDIGSGTNFFDVGVSGDGGWAEAVYQVGDRLLLLKNNSVWALVFSSADPAYWSQKLISNDVGCVSKFSVVDINGVVYFATAKGIYRTDGFTVRGISDPINRQIFPSNATTPASSISRYLTAGKWNDHYIFSTPYNNVDNLVFLYNTKFDSWWSWTTPTGTLMSFFMEFPNMYWGSATQPVNTLVMIPHTDYALSFAYLAALADGGSMQYSYSERDVDNNIKFVLGDLTTKSYSDGKWKKFADIAVSASAVQNNSLRLQPVVDERTLPDTLSYFRYSRDVHYFRKPVIRYGNSIAARVRLDMSMSTGVVDLRSAIYGITFGIKAGRDLTESTFS